MSSTVQMFVTGGGGGGGGDLHAPPPPPRCGYIQSQSHTTNSAMHAGGLLWPESKSHHMCWEFSQGPSQNHSLIEISDTEQMTNSVAVYAPKD